MNQKIAYLTIDDSPSEDFRNKINFLTKKKIPAIFFCIGKLLSENKEEVINAIKKGFIIGNHSWNHQSFSKLSLKEIREQIIKTDRVIEECYRKSGVKRQMKVFRFSFLDKGGKKKEAIQKILKNLGYRRPHFLGINYKWYKDEGHDKDIDVYPTYDTMDWTVADKSFEHGISNLQGLLDRMDENVPEGGRGINFKGSNEIIMMHDDIRIKEMFQPMINRLLEKGLIFRLPN